MQDSEDRMRDRPVLETARLLLRRPEGRDIDAIVRILGDLDVARRLARIPHPYGRADAVWFLEKIVPAEWVWAVTWRSSGDVVGMAGLTPHDDGTAELGYYVDRGHWGAGIATEAVRTVVRYGFCGLGLRFLTGGYFLDNPASGRVLTKLGFVEVGRGERPCLAAGTTVPSVEMRLVPAAAGEGAATGGQVSVGARCDRGPTLTARSKAGQGYRCRHDIQCGGIQVQPPEVRDHQPCIHRLPWPAAGTYWPLAQE